MAIPPSVKIPIQFQPPPTPRPKPKIWYASRTLWFNAITLAIVILSAMADNQALADPAALRWIAVIIAGGNAVLRMLTEQPLTK